MPGEWFHGLIDEVRISDVARKPEELLFSRAAGVKDASLQAAAK
jgi:hypothetical protein